MATDLALEGRPIKPVFCMDEFGFGQVTFEFEHVHYALKMRIICLCIVYISRIVYIYHVDINFIEFVGESSIQCTPIWLISGTPQKRLIVCIKICLFTKVSHKHNHTVTLALEHGEYWGGSSRAKNALVEAPQKP